MSTQQATLDSEKFESSGYNCPLCGVDIEKTQLSQHLEIDCGSEHQEVNYEY